MFKIIKLTLILFLAAIMSACMNMYAVNELNNAAREYLENNDTKNAISRLESAVELDQKQYRTRYLIIDAYLREKRCEDALPHVIAALQMEEKEPSLYYLASQTYFCIADNIYKNELNLLNEDSIDKKRATTKYLHNLKKGNEALETYYDLKPTVEDAQGMIRTLNENKEKIKQLEQEK